MPNELDDPKKYFTEVYMRNSWGSTLSRSGPGSEGDYARQKIELLKEIITEYEINSILDIGCGDFYWMKEIAPLVGNYHGVDVVEYLVKNNKKQYEDVNVGFQCLDISKPNDQKQLNTRKVDLIICIDVFGHLLNKEVDSLLRFTLNDIDAKFLMVTNRREAGSGDYLKREKNRSEGIDLEQHLIFLERAPIRLKQVPRLFLNDLYDLYSLVTES